MVTASSNVTFALVNLATSPPTTVGVYANIAQARSVASSLTHWEIFYAVPKQQRPGAGGIMTSGSPNLVYTKRIERHGDVRSGPSFGTDEPGSHGGTSRESGSFGV